jgi:hypothetical protein
MKTTARLVILLSVTFALVAGAPWLAFPNAYLLYEDFDDGVANGFYEVGGTWSVADEDYEIEKWFVDGEGVQEGGDSFTLPDLRAPHQVSVSFKEAPREVSLTISSPHGSPDPAVGTYTYTEGETVPGGSVASPADEEDGVRYRCTGYAGTGSAPSSVGTGETSYASFTITEDSELTYHWMAEYRVIASAGEGGSISPAGENWYTLKYDAPFTAEPDEGYVVDKWLLDGEEVQTGGSSYVLRYIRAPHEVFVLFAPIAPGTITVRSNIQVLYQLRKLPDGEPVTKTTDFTEEPKLFQRIHKDMEAGDWEITWLSQGDAWPHEPVTETKTLVEGETIVFTNNYIVNMPSDLYQLIVKPINYATGLFTVRVRIVNARGDENPPARTFTAPIWLVVKDITFGVVGPHSEGRLWNADGITSAEYPDSGSYYYKDVSGWAPIAPGEESPEVVLEFYIKDRNPGFQPVIEVWADDPVVAGACFRIEHVLSQPPGGVVLQWKSERGAAYSVEVADDLMGPWTAISEEVSSGEGLVGWLDSPPEGVRCRFYRVRLLSP